MNNSLKNSISHFFRPLPLNILRKRAGKKLIIPLYHLVTDEPPVHIKHLYRPRTVGNFIKDIEFLTRHYKVLNDEEFYSAAKSAEGPHEDGFLLTFDDGCREIYDYVAPYLYQMGIPAIFFINNNFVGNRDMFYRFKSSILVEEINNCNNSAILKEISGLFGLRSKFKAAICRKILALKYPEKGILDSIAEIIGFDFNKYLIDRKPYMDMEQIRELQQKGFIIGAHTIDHQSLSDLDEDELINQVRESMERTLKDFSPRYRYFAFPFNDLGVNINVLGRMHEMKNSIVDLSFGSSGLKPELIKGHIQRIPMEPNTGPAEQIIKTEYVIYLIKNTINRMKR